MWLNTVEVVCVRCFQHDKIEGKIEGKITEVDESTNNSMKLQFQNPYRYHNALWH
jgi:lipocalin